MVVNQKFQEFETSFADILNLIYGYRIQNVGLEKYGSVLEKELFEENIDIKIIETLINAVNDHLYLIQRYLKIKSSLLEIDAPHLYDFGVSLVPNFVTKYSLEEAIEIIKNALKPLGEEYLEVVFQLFQGHIDAKFDENKHQFIVFSWNTYSFMNFKGTYTDLKNLVHELGHIVHYYFSKMKQPFIYEDSTVFVGEIASIVNEILLNRYLYEHATTFEEKIFYLNKEIENYLYDFRESEPFTAKVISEKYSTLIQKYYGSEIVYDEVSSIEWTRLGHLYRWSYYPYKYATGLMIGSILVHSLVDDHSLSKEKYLDFLASGSSLYSFDLLKKLNVDLTSSDVICNGFQIMEDDIEKLNQVLN